MSPMYWFDLIRYRLILSISKKSWSEAHRLFQINFDLVPKDLFETPALPRLQSKQKNNRSFPPGLIHLTNDLKESPAALSMIKSKPTGSSQGLTGPIVDPVIKSCLRTHSNPFWFFETAYCWYTTWRQCHSKLREQTELLLANQLRKVLPFL